MKKAKKVWLRMTGRADHIPNKADAARSRLAIPEMTPMGFKLAGHDAMGRGDFEPTETRLVQHILPKVHVFVNIGANIGYYCCLALKASQQVVAFEPIAENVQYLLANARANGWEASIEVYPLALSDRIGVIDIYGSGTWASVLKGWAGTPENDVDQVPTNRLDNVLAERLNGQRSFILVDIEGAELLMLAGASRILEQTPAPIWLMEISVDEHQPGDLVINPKLRQTFDIFWDCGYEAWTATDNPRRVTSSEIDEIAKTGADTLATHNFLFIKSQPIDQILDNSSD